MHRYDEGVRHHALRVDERRMLAHRKVPGRREGGQQSLESAKRRLVLGELGEAAGAVLLEEKVWQAPDSAPRGVVQGEAALEELERLVYIDCAVPGGRAC